MLDFKCQFYVIQYHNWMSTEWQQVAFTDELHFMLHQTDGRWCIWHEIFFSLQHFDFPATFACGVQAGGERIMV